MPPHAVGIDQYDHHYQYNGSYNIGKSRHHDYYLHPRSKPDLLVPSECITQGPPLLKPRKKSVSFARTKKVYKAPKSHRGVPTSEKWYCEKDHQQMLQHCMKTIAWVTSVPKGKRKETLHQYENTFCMNGLEELTPGGIRRKMKHVKTGLATVFQEQERQRTMGAFSPEVLSEVYFDKTFSCLERFFTRAIKLCSDVYPEYRLLELQHSKSKKNGTTRKI